MLVGAALADVGLRDHERRLAFHLHGAAEHAVDGVEVVTVALEHLPAIRLETLARIIGEGEVGRALDGDVVGVVDEAEPVELEAAGEGACLVGNALLHVAVAAEAPGAVIRDWKSLFVPAGGVHALGDRHAHGHCHALAERTRGHLDAGAESALGMACAARPHLAEGLELVELEVASAAQMQQGIDERRSVAAGEHEAVAVGPRWVLRVELEKLEPKGRGNVGKTQRNAWVSACGLLHHVGRETADGVGDKLQLIISVLHDFLLTNVNADIRPRNGAKSTKVYHNRPKGAMSHEKSPWDSKGKRDNGGTFAADTEIPRILHHFANPSRIVSTLTA